MTPDELLRENRRRAQAAVQGIGVARMRKMLERAQADLERAMADASGLRGPGKESFTAVRARVVLAQVRDVLGAMQPGMRKLLVDQGVEVSDAQTAGTLRYLEEAERLFSGIAQPLGLHQASVVDEVRQGAEASVLRRIDRDPDHPGRPGVLARYGASVIGKFELELQQRALTGKPWAEVRAQLVKDSPFLQGAPAHWAERIVRTECLVGSTRVTGARINAVVGAVFRRWYEGDVVSFATEAGRDFTATPNHPMLTRRGWVAAGELREGDDLVCYRGEKDALSPGDEHVADAQPTIAEVFDAFQAVGIRERRRTAQPDFHGDGADGDVDITHPLRSLEIGSFAPIREPLREHVFAPADQSRARFCRLCMGLLSVDESPCFCRRSPSAPRLLEPKLDHAVGHAERLSDLLRPDPALVLPEDFLGRDVHAVGRSDAASVEELPPRARQVARQARRAHRLLHEVAVEPVGFLDSVGAQAGDIEFDRLRSVSVRVFRGHVFNLSTADGYFTANGAYTGNCMAASNRASQETMAIADEQLGGDMLKVLVASFDGRTSWDSYQQHGQVRRVSEAFQDWSHSYMHPPNRPNDRETVVPHRASWPLPKGLLPKSDAEVAAAWAREGRKGSPPARPLMSTVDLKQVRAEAEERRAQARAAPVEVQAKPAPAVEQAVPAPAAAPVRAPRFRNEEARARHASDRLFGMPRDEALSIPGEDVVRHPLQSYSREPGGESPWGSAGSQRVIDLARELRELERAGNAPPLRQVRVEQIVALSPDLFRSNVLEAVRRASRASRASRAPVTGDAPILVRHGGVLYAQENVEAVVAAHLGERRTVQAHVVDLDARRPWPKVEAKPEPKAPEPAKPDPAAKQKVPVEFVKRGFSEHVEAAGVTGAGSDSIVGLRVREKYNAAAANVFGPSGMPTVATLQKTWGSEEAGHTIKLASTYANSSGDEVKFTGNILASDGRKIGDIVRTFKRHPNGRFEVHHDFFKINDVSEQGKKGGSAMLRQAIQTYEKLGVDEVTVDAAWVGRYAWATFGYNWDASTAREKSPRLARYLKAKGVEEKRAVAIAEGASKRAWDVAALDVDGITVTVESEGKMVPCKVGKAFLLEGGMWSGKIVLDPKHETYQRAKERIGL